MKAVQVGQHDGGQRAAAVELALAQIYLADNALDGRVEHGVVERVLRLQFAQLGLAHLRARDVEVLLRRSGEQ